MINYLTDKLGGEILKNSIDFNLRFNKISKLKTYELNNDTFYINLLAIGKTDICNYSELTEKQLDLLNNLQKINISLINRNVGKSKRQQALRDYAENFKIANY